MSVPHFLVKLVGEWVGSNRLWLSPQESARQSAITAAVALVANG